MKILYLPLDERPCNYQYPIDIAKTNQEIEIVRPKLSQLGLKKKAADNKAINQFLFDNCEDESIIVCSIDMLVYGGLIPSRIHQHEINKLIENLEVLKELKAKYKNVKIYALSSIMRTPSYSSSDEEPDYYEEYGTEIFKRKYILDQIDRDGSTKELELELLKYEVPEEIIADYEKRRLKNLKITEEVLNVLKAEIIDHLVIFQDDSAPYGYTAIDQQHVKNIISDQNLDTKVDIYPGADEVGCSLLARAYNEQNQINNMIYVEYSSINGPSLTPLYEDRPMYETLKAHIAVTNSILVNNDDADYILMINSPGLKMQESWDQVEMRDRTYDSHRNLKAFVQKIAYYIKQNKRVAIADCAYANGCDLELIKLLDQAGLIDQIYAYTGWNTHANTLGTVICAMQIANKLNHQVLANNINHIIEAGFYQAKIRMDINKNYLPLHDLNYFDLKDKEEQVVNLELTMVRELYEQLSLANKYELVKLDITHPWNRMFEIEVKSEIKEI